MTAAASAFAHFLDVLENKLPVARRTFCPPLTENEQTDLLLNWQGELPQEVLEVLRVANGQADVLLGPLWPYKMLGHQEMYYRKNLYRFYFDPADVPLFEDGNGGFIFWRGGRVLLSEYTGDLVREFETLAALFEHHAEALGSGRAQIVEEDSGGLLCLHWVEEGA